MITTCNTFRRFAPNAAAVLIATAGLVIAGSLNLPSGPVASTKKTMIEIEPRIAINTTSTPSDAVSMFKITQTGSYHLTGDLVALANKVGISVTTRNVTIDLNGYGSISSAGAAQAAIAKTSSTGSHSVHNRSVQSPFDVAAVSEGSAARIEELTITQGAISISGGPSTVRSCRITGGGFRPLITLAEFENASSVIEDCQPIHTSSTGSGTASSHKDTTIRRCTISSTSSFDSSAILARASGRIIEDCSVRGFLAGVNGASIVKNCTIADVLGSGVLVSAAAPRSCWATVSVGAPRRFSVLGVA